MQMDLPVGFSKLDDVLCMQLLTEGQKCRIKHLYYILLKFLV